KLLEGMEYIFESSMPLKDQKRKTYGDIFESLLGAIYLDLGLVVVHDRIKYLMHKYGHASNLYRVEKYAAAWSGTYVSMEVPLFADELLYTRERAVEFTSTEPRRFVQRAGMAMGGKPDILRGLRKVDLQKNRPFWSTHFKFEGAQSSYVRSFTNSDVHARMINAWRRRGVGLTNEAVTPMTRFAIDLDGVDAESVLFDAPLHAYAGYTIADVIQTRVCEMFRKTGLSRAHCIMLDISRANKYSQHMHWPFLPLRPQQVQCRLAELQQYIASEKIAFEKKRHGAQFVDYARSWLAKRVCAEKACSRDKVPAVRVCEIDGQVDVYCAQHPKTKKESDFTKRSITTASPSQIESAFGVRTHRMWQDYIDAGMFTSRKLRMYLSDKVDDRKGHDGEELGHPVHQRSVFLPCEVEPGVEGKLKRPVLLSHFVDRRKFHHQAVPICHFDVLNLVSLRHPSYMMDYRFEHQDQKYPGYWNALEEFSGTQQPEPDYALDSFLAACLHGFDVIERDKEKDGSKQSCDWKLPWKDDPSYRAVYMVTSRVGGDTIKDKHRIELWVDGEMLVWAERLRRPDAILKAKMELVKLIEPQAVKSLGSMLDEWSSPCRLDDDPPSEGNRSYSPPQPAPSHSKKRTKANNVLTRRFLEHNTANTPGSGTLFVPLFGLRAQGSQLLPQIQQPAALPETPRQQDQVSLQSQQRVAQPMVAQKVPETPQSEQDQVPLQTQQPSAQPVVPHQSQAASPCRQQESPTPLQTQQPSAQPVVPHQSQAASPCRQQESPTPLQTQQPSAQPIPPHHSPAVSPSGQQPQQSTAPPQTQQPPAPARELQQPEEARSAPPAARQQAPRSHEQPPASAAQPGPGAQQAPGGQPCLKPRPGSPQPQDPASCPPAQENHGTPQTGWGPDPTPPHSAAGTLVRGDSPEAAEHNGVNGAAPSAAQRPAPRSHEQPPGPAAQPGKDEQRELSGGQPCLRPRPAAPGPPSPQPQDPASASPPAQQSHGTPQPRPAMDPTPPHSATGTPVRGDSTQSAERTGAAPPPHADRRDPLPAAAFPYRTLGPSPAALGGSSPSDGRGSNGAPPPARPSAAQTSRPPGPSQEDAKRSSERSFGSPTNHATATTFGSRASIASQESPATTPTPTFKPAVGPELSMLSPALFKPPAADVGAGGNPAKKQPVKSKKTQLEREAEQLEKTQMRVRWLWGNCRSGVAQYWRGVGRRLRQGPKHVALYVPKGPCRFYCLLGILEAGLPSEVLYYGDGDDCADLPFVLHQFKYATSKDEAAKMLSVVNFVDVKSSTQLLKEPLKKCVVLNIVENEPTASFALRISFLDTTVVTKILFMSLGEDTRDEYFITNRPAEGSGKDDVLVEGVERCLFGARLQLE
ncbi:Dicer, partial [Diplonema papillatum]